MTAALVFSSGCSVKHHFMTEEDHADRARADLQVMYSPIPERQGEYSVEDLIAHAVRRNLDHRIAMIEEALAVDQIDLAELNFWPNGVFNGQAQRRSNDSGGRSQSLLTAEESLEPSTSQERQSRFANVELVWNLLDFGVSYVTAQQRYEERDILYERRRKAAHALARDVFSTYLSAAVGQRYDKVVDDLIEELRAMVDSHERLIEKGLKLRDALLAQRELHKVQDRLWKLKDQFATQRLKLLELANLPLNTQLKLMEPQPGKQRTNLKVPVDQLESAALRMRPELRIEGHNAHMSALEARKEVFRMFPGLEFGLGSSRDANKFLFNKSWSNAGLRISWNLLDLVRGKKLRKLRAAEHDLAIVRRQALSVAVLMQVRLATQKYHLQQRRFEHATKVAGINSRVWMIDKRSPQSRTRLDILKSKTDALISIIQRENSHARLRASRVDVLHSLGVDLLPPDDTPENPVSSVAIGQHLKNTMSRYFHDDS